MVQYLLYCWYRKSGKYWARQSLFKLNFKQTGTSLEIVTVICSIFPYLLDLWPRPELFVEGVQTYWHQSEFVLARRSQILNTGWSFAIAVYDVLGARFLTVWRHNIVIAGKQYMHCDDILKAVWRSCDDNCDHSVTTAWRHRYASMTAVWRCVTTERQRVCR